MRALPRIAGEEFLEEHVVERLGLGTKPRIQDADHDLVDARALPQLLRLFVVALFQFERVERLDADFIQAIVADLQIVQRLLFQAGWHHQLVRRLVVDGSKRGFHDVARIGPGALNRVPCEGLLDAVGKSCAGTGIEVSRYRLEDVLLASVARLEQARFRDAGDHHRAPGLQLRCFHFGQRDMTGWQALGSNAHLFLA